MPDFLPLMTFVTSTAFTPGPNNIMVTASGANYGYRRTLPHILGVAAGAFGLFLRVNFISSFIFEAFPWLHSVMKYLGAIYLLYLAYRIATSGSAKGAKGSGKPLTFLQSAAFQWINPKAWTMGPSALVSFTSYDGQSFYAPVLLVAGCYMVVGFLSSSTWTLFGRAIGSFLESEKNLRIFNISMAVLLVLSLVMVFLPA